MASTRGHYHDVLACEQEVGNHGLHAVQELHASGNVQRKPQRLVLVHHNACIDNKTTRTCKLPSRVVTHVSQQ